VVRRVETKERLLCGGVNITVPSTE
jgi:hypothetical protein